MKILIIGSTGMAGHMIERYLNSKGHDIKTAARANADYKLDINSTDNVIASVKNLGNDYDFIVNCIGLLVTPCIKSPTNAILINSWFPHFLENTFKDTRTKIIHLSTDCIFDGATGNYSETSTPTETNMYGRSKLLGELNNNKDITFRMSIIGPELKENGTGLFHWLCTNELEELSGWSNAWWNGLTTLQLAKCIDEYINNPVITGIVHLTRIKSKDCFLKITKYDLLCKINTIFGLNKKINNTQGPKGVNKILINNRNDEFNFKIPATYDDMLHELKNFMETADYTGLDHTGR